MAECRRATTIAVDLLGPTETAAVTALAVTTTVMRTATEARGPEPNTTMIAAMDGRRPAVGPRWTSLRHRRPEAATMTPTGATTARRRRPTLTSMVVAGPTTGLPAISRLVILATGLVTVAAIPATTTAVEVEAAVVAEATGKEFHTTSSQLSLESAPP